MKKHQLCTFLLLIPPVGEYFRLIRIFYRSTQIIHPNNLNASVEMIPTVGSSYLFRKKVIESLLQRLSSRFKKTLKRVFNANMHKNVS